MAATALTQEQASLQLGLAACYSACPGAETGAKTREVTVAAVHASAESASWTAGAASYIYTAKPRGGQQERTTRP